MSFHPDAVLADPAVIAAVESLAARNQHHLEAMNPDEQADALAHWRELAIDVLTAARSTLDDPDAPAPDPSEGAPGRAVIVLEDLGGEDVGVHAAFHPELVDVGGGEFDVTPAQAVAMMLLESLEDEDDAGQEGHDHA